MVKIKKILAREIIDSRGNPTVEVDVILDDDKSIGRACVPSGASTGTREALELRDNDQNRFLGKGVLKAIKNIEEIISPRLIGKIPCHQQEIDHTLIELDGTENKSKLGANAILAVSLAVSKAASQYQNIPLYMYIRDCFKLNLKDYVLPVPLMNFINGGIHADNNLDIQEFMIIPAGLKKFSESVRAGCEIFHTLRKILKKNNYQTNVGDEGGFAPMLSKTEGALDMLIEAIKAAGYKPAEEIFLGLDVAASELYEDGKYKFKGENKEFTSEELINCYSQLIEKYPIISIEDGLSEDDWDGWKKLTEKLGSKIQLVGDDLFTTNPKILKKGIEEKVANAILVKPNQIGTLTETIETIKKAYEANYNVIISHRSGETEDTFIADLAVAVNSGQIKTGSISRTDRTAKYNQLLRIEAELKEEAKFLGTEKIFRE